MPRRLVVAALAAVVLGSCRIAVPDTLVAEPRTLAGDGPVPAGLGPAEVLSIHGLHSGRQWFGGISGIAFDGHAVTAVNDVGHWLRFAMEVDTAGRPVAFGGLEIGPLGGLDGSKEDGDAEEVVATPRGWLVSFERRHRLLSYGADLAGVPAPVAAPAGFADQPENGGVEAVAALADGRLLLLSEEGEDADGTGWGWIGRAGAWQRLGYRRSGTFHPTAAAALPDGGVLVLERSFSLVGGIGTRLVRIEAAALRPGAVVEGREILRLQPPLLVDNYEALAVWQRADGRLVAYIVSDDNFSSLQSTLLMAVLLP